MRQKNCENFIKQSMKDYKKDYYEQLIKTLDKAFDFAIIKIVNPTVFPRFGERRQFFYYD